MSRPLSDLSQRILAALVWHGTPSWWPTVEGVRGLLPSPPPSEQIVWNELAALERLRLVYSSMPDGVSRWRITDMGQAAAPRIARVRSRPGESRGQSIALIRAVIIARA